MGDRMRQVNSMLREAVSRVLSQVRIVPDGVLLTVTRVRTSSDLRQARVFFTVFPSKYAADVHASLRKSRRAIQNNFADQIQLKYTPRLYFAADAHEQKAQEMEELLDTLQDSSSSY